MAELTPVQIAFAAIIGFFLFKPFLHTKKTQKEASPTWQSKTYEDVRREVGEFGGETAPAKTIYERFDDWVQILYSDQEITNILLHYNRHLMNIAADARHFVSDVERGSEYLESARSNIEEVDSHSTILHGLLEEIQRGSANYNGELYQTEDAAAIADALESHTRMTFWKPRLSTS